MGEMKERDDCNSNTGAIILFSQNAVRAQFSARHNAICVEKVITVMIWCLPKSPHRVRIFGC